MNINPLNVLRKRIVNTMPMHFSKIAIDTFYDREIVNWIDKKLEGRYFLKFSPNVDQTGNLKNQLYAGFEEEAELTYFLLACPHIRRK